MTCRGVLQSPLLWTGQHAIVQGATCVTVQDFEKGEVTPSVWVVNIPDENAAITLTLGQPKTYDTWVAVEGDLYLDSLRVDSEKSIEEPLGCQVAVVSPDYGADVQGDTRVILTAAGFKSVTAQCWQQGGAFGTPATVAVVALDAQGKGSFIFPADTFPHGPITVTISGDNGTVKDNCYLQLYNQGGVSWKEGLPDDPPAARGMSLVFADDFDGPLSISSTDLSPKPAPSSSCSIWPRAAAGLWICHDIMARPMCMLIMCVCIVERIPYEWNYSNRGKFYDGLYQWSWPKEKIL